VHLKAYELSIVQGVESGVVAGETKCPWGCSLATALLLSLFYIAVN
jgi:hypothetical protein